MDPLSDVLSFLRPRSHLAAALDLGRRWSIGFPSQGSAIKCNALISGECWVTVDGDEAVRARAGDVFLLPSGRPFQIADDPSRSAVRAEDVIPPNRVGPICTLDGGGTAFLVSIRFELAADGAALLTDLLPPVALIRGDTDAARHLRYFVNLMVEELRADQAGSALAVEHLSHLILMQSLRLCQAERLGRAGWLFAMADERIGAALTAIHGDPSQKWTLDGLAGVSCLSRSVFARRFKQAVGHTPMDYLARWRMLQAGDRLTNSNASLLDIAVSLGYDSGSAFSTAFKKIMGCSPRAYASRGRGAMAANSASALDSTA